MADDKQIIEANDVDRAFRAQNVLPVAEDAFGARPTALKEAIKVANVVIDTNALLIPYGAGATSFSKVIEVFERLRGENRLYIPGQVAREFVKNRPGKIADLHQSLADKISKFAIPDGFSYPILEDIKEYKELTEVFTRAKEVKKEALKKNGELLEVVKSWEWNDPVHCKYQTVFNKENIIEFDEEKESTVKEVQRRKRLIIPPGYKDSTKDDFGIGDYLIWKTILYLGARDKKDTIFISGDEKADWQHRTGNTGILPRYELLDEYRRASEGKTFYIIQLSKLLELLNVEESAVEEIKHEEVRIQEANSVNILCPHCDLESVAKLEDFVGSSSTLCCPQCDTRLHVHRTRSGVTVHREYEKKDKTQEEAILCPYCSGENKARLGLEFNSTTWCKCSACEEFFPIHRSRDGGVKISTR